MAAAKRAGTAPRKAAKKAAPAAPKPAADQAPSAPATPAVDHPYGDVEVYVFHPKDGSDPIVFPKITEVRPTAKFFWKIYEQSELFQSFEWMKLAGVPRSIQERVMDLGERDVYEQAAFFRGWFAPISAPQGGLTPPGES
jgi:hypothetical protein